MTIYKNNFIFKNSQIESSVSIITKEFKKNISNIHDPILQIENYISELQKLENTLIETNKILLQNLKDLKDPNITPDRIRNINNYVENILSKRIEDALLKSRQYSQIVQGLYAEIDLRIPENITKINKLSTKITNGLRNVHNAYMNAKETFSLVFNKVKDLFAALTPAQRAAPILTKTAATGETAVAAAKVASPLWRKLFGFFKILGSAPVIQVTTLLGAAMEFVPARKGDRVQIKDCGNGKPVDGTVLLVTENNNEIKVVIQGDNGKRYAATVKKNSQQNCFFEEL